MESEDKLYELLDSLDYDLDQYVVQLGILAEMTIDEVVLGVLASIKLDYIKLIIKMEI